MILALTVIIYLLGAFQMIAVIAGAPPHPAMIKYRVLLALIWPLVAGWALATMRVKK